MAETTTPSSEVRLTATYTSPTNPAFNLSSTPLPPLPAAADSSTPLSVSQKTAYLAALREATSELQVSINAELTSRMEEDNKHAAAEAIANGTGAGTSDGKSGKKGAKRAIDEDAEEENYGEEVVDEDED